MYKVFFSKKAAKGAEAMPHNQQDCLKVLVDELRLLGPVRSNWQSYGIIQGTRMHHCHLSYRWVACSVETKAGIEVEVIYVGSRGNAPYAKH